MAKIFILGAGAVGQYIGGLLTISGRHKVTMLGRADHYNAIKTSGLTIQTPKEKFSTRRINFVPLVERIPYDEVFDWVFVTTKAFDMVKALRETKHIISRNKKVKFLLFQRGVGSHELLTSFIPEEKIYIAALTSNVAIIEPGTVVQTNKSGVVAVAPLKMHNEIVSIQKIFEGSKIDLLIFEKWRPMKWSALLYEMLNNGFCALTDYTPDKEMEKPELVELEIKAFQEAVQVVEALGIEVIDLPAYAVKKMIFFMRLPDFIRNFLVKKELLRSDNVRVPTIKNTMEKAKEYTEIEYINGAVSLWGKKRKIQTPVNDFLVQELNKVTQGKLSWDEYRKKPFEVKKSFEVFLKYQYKG